MNKIPHADVMRAFLDGKVVQKQVISAASKPHWLSFDPNTALSLPHMWTTDIWRIKPVKRTPWQVYMDAQYPHQNPHRAWDEGASTNKGLNAVIAAAKAGEFDES